MTGQPSLFDPVYWKAEQVRRSTPRLPDAATLAEVIVCLARGEQLPPHADAALDAVLALAGDTGTGSIAAVFAAAGQVGRDHPATSKQAARSMRFGSQRHTVLGVVIGTPSTAAEVADRLGLSRNQVATRLGELRQAGYVTWATDDHGRIVERATGPSDTGRVHRATLLGHGAYDTAPRRRR